MCYRCLTLVRHVCLYWFSKNPHPISQTCTSVWYRGAYCIIQVGCPQSTGCKQYLRTNPTCSHIRSSLPAPPTLLVQPVHSHPLPHVPQIPHGLLGIGRSQQQWSRICMGCRLKPHGGQCYYKKATGFSTQIFHISAANTGNLHYRQLIEQQTRALW